MRTTILISAMAVLAVLAGCEKDAVEEPREVPRNVRVLTTRLTDLEEYIEITGPVLPVRGADVSAEEGGVVVAIAAGKGTPVATGQVIVEQRRAILKAEMQAARASLTAQAFNVEQTRKLREAGKISELEILNTESAYEQTAALARIARERYDRAAIKAPFAGIVTDRYVELGQLVAPGTPVARVIDPYTLKLEAYVTDSVVPWVRVGAEAVVTLGENGDRADGTVTWVGLEADRRTGKFRVEIEIPNPGLRLHSGLIGRARLPGNRVEDVIVIPRDAVLSGTPGPSVFVIEGDRAFRRNVTLGIDQGLMTIVRAGLSPDERLVVRGQRDLVDSTLVAVTETSSADDGGLPGDPAVVRGAEAGARIADPAAASPEAGK